MAYSQSPVTVERMRPWLEPLVGGGEIRWRTEPGQSRRFAYRVREALHAANTHSAAFPDLAPCYGAYEIKVESSMVVAAIPRTARSVEIVVDRQPQTTVDPGSDLHWQDLIDAWNSRGGDTRLYFPHANLNGDLLTELWEWGQSNNVLVFENSGAVTLTEWDDDTAPFAWDPSDLENS